MEEVELSWEDYLEETGSTAVPYGSFKHVSILGITALNIKEFHSLSWST